jgi:hypothetical protein
MTEFGSYKPQKKPGIAVKTIRVQVHTPGISILSKSGLILPNLTYSTKRVRLFLRPVSRLVDHPTHRAFPFHNFETVAICDFRPHLRLRVSAGFSPVFPIIPV